VLPFGVGIALSPVPIIAVVLMLATPKGRVNGPAFLAGWIVGIAGLGTIVLLVASGASASTHGGPATWVSILKIVLGALLVLLAVKQWRGRPRGDAAPELPAWMKTIDTFTPVKSAGMAVLLADVNPKNLLLVVGGAACAREVVDGCRSATGGDAATPAGPRHRHRHRSVHQFDAEIEPGAANEHGIVGDERNAPADCSGSDPQVCIV